MGLTRVCDFVISRSYMYSHAFQCLEHHPDHGLSCLFFVALWPPAGKGLTSWLFVGDVYCIFVNFPCGILGQVWYLVVSFPYFVREGSLNHC